MRTNRDTYKFLADQQRVLRHWATKRELDPDVMRRVLAGLASEMEQFKEDLLSR